MKRLPSMPPATQVALIIVLCLILLLIVAGCKAVTPYSPTQSVIQVTTAADNVTGHAAAIRILVLSTTGVPYADKLLVELDGLEADNATVKEGVNTITTEAAAQDAALAAAQNRAVKAESAYKKLYNNWLNRTWRWVRNSLILLGSVFVLWNVIIGIGRLSSPGSFFFVAGKFLVQIFTFLATVVFAPAGLFMKKVSAEIVEHTMGTPTEK